MPFRHLPGVTTCKFKKGDYLLRRGLPMNAVFYLKKGAVKREVMSSNGDIHIMIIKESGQIVGSIVGLLCIYDKAFDGNCSDDFIAEEECVCYRVPIKVCKDFLRGQPELLEEIISLSVSVFDELERKVNSRKEHHGTALLCHFLLTKSHLTTEGPILSKKYTNVEIGKYLSMHPVTVSRIINALKKEDVLERTSQGILIKESQQLQQYLAENKSLMYY